LDIWGTAWAQLGAVGLLGVVFLLLFTGRLLPRSLVRETLDRAERSVTAADQRAEDSRKAAELADQRADLYRDTMREMLRSIQSVERLVGALGPGDRRDAIG